MFPLCVVRNPRDMEYVYVLYGPKTTTMRAGVCAKPFQRYSNVIRDDPVCGSLLLQLLSQILHPRGGLRSQFMSPLAKRLAPVINVLQGTFSYSRT